MPYFTLEFWAVVLSGIGLLFCAGAILCFKRNKNKYNEGRVEHESGNPLNDFGEELSSQMVTQHAEIALELVSGVIERERQALKQFGENGGMKRSPNPIPVEIPEKPMGHFYNSGNPATRISPIPDQYDEAARLADLGTGMEKICEQVNLPRGEVELVLNLKKGMRAPYDKRQAGGQSLR